MSWVAVAVLAMLESLLLGIAFDCVVKCVFGPLDMIA